MQIDAAREQMINQQLRAWDVLDQDVLHAFAGIAREQFVPAAYRELAYADIELPLGRGDHMLAPKVAGRIVQAVAPRANERVLEVGTGSGYLTAALASFAHSVRSLEIREDLAAGAQKNLSEAGVRNASVVQGDAFAPEALGHETYEVIVLAGSLPLDDPRFARQLTIGGRLFAVIGQGVLMEACLIERIDAEQFRRTVLFETSLKALVGAPQPTRFAF